MNYTLSVAGYKKYIYPDVTLFHHGEKRDYHYNYDDMLYNRMTAHYLFRGKEGLWLFKKWSKGRPATLNSMAERCYEQHKDHRERIKKIQKMDIRDWAKQFGYERREE